MKRTKIVCTIGPASEKKITLEKMVKVGMNIARLNFSHGDYAHHKILIKNIRAVAKKLKQPVAIIADLQGPRIRVGELPEKGVKLAANSQVILTTSSSKRAGEKIPVTYLKLHEDVKKGDRILLADGLMELKVKAVKGHDIACEVINGGLLTSHKGINLPNIAVSLNAITEKDKQDLKFGIKEKVDFVALSFATNAKDVINLRSLIGKYEKELKIKRSSPIKIIVKIERHQAVDNFEEILEATDAVMVARGDLGIEMTPEEVPLIQKRLISQALEKAKPVIVATQMLESMIENPRPTRAEVSDIANAVIDHTDAVMLSGETAIGKYPVEAVEIMAKVILATEESIYDNLSPDSDGCNEDGEKIQPIEDAIGNTANILSRSIDAKAILVTSLSGETGRMVSRYRPELPIFVAANNERVERQLNLSWGVVPFVLPFCKTLKELLDRSISYIKKQKIAKKKDKIIIVAGEPVGKSGVVNLVEIKEI